MPSFNSVAVIGAGAWGTALAGVAVRAGREVVLCARSAAHAADIAATRTNPNKTLLCLLPATLLFFWNTRSKKKTHRAILSLLFLTATTLWPIGCGSGGDPNIRITPPGTYQYQVTASSTTGVALTQTVTLNLVVTAH